MRRLGRRGAELGTWVASESSESGTTESMFCVPEGGRLRNRLTRSWKVMGKHGSHWRSWRLWEITGGHGRSWESMGEHGRSWRSWEIMRGHGREWELYEIVGDRGRSWEIGHLRVREEAVEDGAGGGGVEEGERRVKESGGDEGR